MQSTLYKKNDTVKYLRVYDIKEKKDKINLRDFVFHGTKVWKSRMIR